MTVQIERVEVSNVYALIVRDADGSEVERRLVAGRKRARGVLRLLARAYQSDAD
jgi:hypothetical protein